MAEADLDALSFLVHTISRTSDLWAHAMAEIDPDDLPDDLVNALTDTMLALMKTQTSLIGHVGNYFFDRDGTLPPEVAEAIMKLAELNKQLEEDE